ADRGAGVDTAHEGARAALDAEGRSEERRVGKEGSRVVADVDVAGKGVVGIDRVGRVRRRDLDVRVGLLPDLVGIGELAYVGVTGLAVEGDAGEGHVVPRGSGGRARR